MDDDTNGQKQIPRPCRCLGNWSSQKTCNIFKIWSKLKLGPSPCMLQCFQRFQCFKTITARSSMKARMIHPFHHHWLIDVSSPMSKIVQSCNQPDTSSPYECNPWRGAKFAFSTFSKQVMQLLSRFFSEQSGTLRNKTVKVHHFFTEIRASDSSIWRSCRAFTKNSKKQMPCLAKGLVVVRFFSGANLLYVSGSTQSNHPPTTNRVQATSFPRIVAIDWQWAIANDQCLICKNQVMSLKNSQQKISTKSCQSLVVSHKPSCRSFIHRQISCFKNTASLDL